MITRPYIWRSGMPFLNEQDCACAASPGELLMRAAAGRPETDCACSDAPAASEVAPAAPGPWRQAGSTVTVPVSPGYALLANPLRSGEVALLNQPGLDRYASYRISAPLPPDAFDRQLAELALLEPVGEHAAAPRPPETLVVWLHLTHACNLACRYCYLEPARGAMSDATARRVVDGLIRAALGGGFAALKLKYAGGEPLLNFERVRQLHAMAAVAARDAGLRLQEVLLSNGVGLSDSHVAFIRDAGMRLMISLDGAGPGQDAARPDLAGRGTAARVRHSIGRALALGVEPSLSITITRLNLADLGSAVDLALEHGLPFSLNFYRGERAELRPEPQALIAALQPILARVAQHDRGGSLLGIGIDRLHMSSPHDRSCGAGDNYLVLDTGGNVARCHMLLGAPVGGIDGPSPLDAVRRTEPGFSHLPAGERTPCRSCTWRHWCGGGCPLDAHLTAGDWRDPSPYCSVYRALIPEILLLEGQRLLRQAQPVN